MRQLLLAFVIYGVLKSAQCVNGIIWDKQSGNFVPIFSVPSFAAMRQEILRKSRELEMHNFEGKIIRFTYYEMTNLINTVANGTKVSGAIGETWNILSEYLNFTLKPMLSEYRTLGRGSSDGSYASGLLRTIQLNETDVIPRVEAYNLRRHATQFSIPLWKTDYRLYIRREVKFLSTWMLKLFSPKVWYLILLTYLLLTVCGYICQKTGMALTRQHLTVKLNDYLFHNFGIIVGQSYSWECVLKSASIVELWLNVFSFLIRSAFSALIINYIWWTTVTYPFEDIDSLVKDTSYNILTLSGSFPDLLFELNMPEYVEAEKLLRHSAADTMEELYTLGCLKKKKWAIFIDADIKKASGMFICRLNPVGRVLFKSFIASGISRNFEYKKTIDIGILKLYEVGLMRLMRNRWLDGKNVEEENRTKAEQIHISEVYLVIHIFTVGSLTAFVILVLENLSFYCNKRS